MFKSVLFSQVGSTEVREGGLQREDDPADGKDGKILKAEC